MVAACGCRLLFRAGNQSPRRLRRPRRSRRVPAAAPPREASRVLESTNVLPHEELPLRDRMSTHAPAPSVTSETT